MSEFFDYVRHPHVDQRKEAGPPTVADAAIALHGPGPIGRFNAKVGLKITLIVGTMWTAYLFTLIALVSAPAAFKTGDKNIIVAWIAQTLLPLVLLPIIIVAQTFLQLVLLPIITLGQNVQAAAADSRSLATYNDASAVLEEAKQIQVHRKVQDDAIQQILATMSAWTASKPLEMPTDREQSESESHRV